jgi:hypothetical protein
MVKLFFRSFHVGEEIGLWLISAFEQSFVQFGVSLAVFYFLTHLSQLRFELFNFLLFLLKPICKQKTLLNSSLACGRRLRDSLNECVTHFETFSTHVAITCHMHDGLIELLLNHLIMSESLLAHSKFSLDLSVTLTRHRL